MTHFTNDRRLAMVLALLWGLSGLGHAQAMTPMNAQSSGLSAPPAERDPTQAPSAARVPTATPPSASSDAASGAAPSPADSLQAALRHHMTVNGRTYLVERGWLRGVGDHLGDARIERIDATSVWLRENGTLRQWPLYPQVQITRIQPPAARPAQQPQAGAPARAQAQAIGPAMAPLSKDAP
jgi:hypothetical protein